MSDPEAKPLSQPPRLAVWEAPFLMLIIAGCLLSWARYYFKFEMPNLDFLQTREMAQAIYGWHLPGTLKRMPGYPLLLGAVASFITAEKPYVHAAMIIGLGCSALSLVVLFKLSRRLVGRAGILVVVGLAATPTFSLMSTQPLAEALIGLLILATFWLVLPGNRWSRWAYVTAGWVAICRQDCVVLIPIVWGLGLAEQPREWWKHSLMAIAAALPLVGWKLFAWWAAPLSDGADAYVSEIAGMSFHLEWRKIALMLEPYPGVGVVFQGPFLLLALIGVGVALRRWRGMALAILGFFLFYNAVHVVFGIYRLRYAYPVLFVVPLFAVTGGQWLLGWLQEKTDDRPRLQLGAVAVIGVLGVAWTANRWMDFSGFRLMHWQHREDFLGLAVLLLVTAGAATWWALAGRRATVRGGLAVGVVAFLSGPTLLSAGTRAHEQGYYEDENIRFRYAADWIDRLMPEGKTAAIPMGESLLYFDDRIDPSKIYDISQFNSQDADAFFHDLDRKGVDYVIKVSTLRRPNDPEDLNYNRNLHYYYERRDHLVEPFRDGEHVSGFELVHVITHGRESVVPIEPVFIYRVVRDHHPDEAFSPTRLDQSPLLDPPPEDS